MKKCLLISLFLFSTAVIFANETKKLTFPSAMQGIYKNYEYRDYRDSFEYLIITRDDIYIDGLSVNAYLKTKYNDLDKIKITYDIKAIDGGDYYIEFKFSIVKSLTVSLYYSKESRKLLINYYYPDSKRITVSLDKMGSN